MKVCLVQQALFTYIGHAIALQLKEKMPGVLFCAFAQGRSGHLFLNTQQDISYGPIPLEEDFLHKLPGEKLDLNFLSQFEKEYGIPNLWPYLYIDRIIMHGQYRREYPYDKALLSHEEMLTYLQIAAKELSIFLDREKPDAAVFSVIGSVGSLLLYHMCKKRGVRTFVIKSTRIGQGVTLTEDYATLDAVHTRFLERMQKNSPPLAAAEKFVDDFRKKPAPYSQKASPTFNNQTARSANIRFLKPHKLAWSLFWHSKMLVNQLLWTPKDYTDIRIWWTIGDKIKRKIRGLIGYNKFYSTPDYSKKFAFYPLHLEPETALLLDSPYHTDQLELIRAVAHALPIDTLLYVKEHPEMVGYRTRAYYREICKIPNVRLIHPRTVSYDLIEKASLIFTITGTAGFEGALYKKPIITFTHVYFNALSCVKRCKDFEELPFIIASQLSTPPIHDNELLQYVSALIEESVNVDYGGLWTGGLPAKEIAKDSGLREFTSLLYTRLKDVERTG